MWALASTLPDDSSINSINAHCDSFPIQIRILCFECIIHKLEATRLYATTTQHAHYLVSKPFTHSFKSLNAIVRQRRYVVFVNYEERQDGTALITFLQIGGEASSKANYLLAVTLKHDFFFDAAAKSQNSKSLIFSFGHVSSQGFSYGYAQPF